MEISSPRDQALAESIFGRIHGEPPKIEAVDTANFWQTRDKVRDLMQQTEMDYARRHQPEDPSPFKFRVEKDLAIILGLRDSDRYQVVFNTAVGSNAQKYRLFGGWVEVLDTATGQVVADYKMSLTSQPESQRPYLGDLFYVDPSTARGESLDQFFGSNQYLTILERVGSSLKRDLSRRLNQSAQGAEPTGRTGRRIVVRPPSASPPGADNFGQ